ARLLLARALCDLPDRPTHDRIASIDHAHENRPTHTGPGLTKPRAGKVRGRRAGAAPERDEGTSRLVRCRPDGKLAASSERGPSEGSEAPRAAVAGSGRSLRTHAIAQMCTQHPALSPGQSPVQVAQDRTLC